MKLKISLFLILNLFMNFTLSHAHPPASLHKSISDAISARNPFTYSYLLKKFFVAQPGKKDVLILLDSLRRGDLPPCFIHEFVENVIRSHPTHHLDDFFNATDMSEYALSKKGLALVLERMNTRLPAQNHKASIHSRFNDLSKEIVNAYIKGEERHGFFFNHEDHKSQGVSYVLNAQFEWDEQYGPQPTKTKNNYDEYDNWDSDDEDEGENESDLVHTVPEHEEAPGPIPKRPEGLHWSLVYLHHDQKGCQIIVTDAAQDASGRGDDLQNKIAFELRSKLPQCKFILETSKRQEDSWNCASFAISDYLTLNKLNSFTNQLASVTTERDLRRNCEHAQDAQECGLPVDPTGVYRTLCALIPTTQSKRMMDESINRVEGPLDKFALNHLSALNRTIIPQQSKNFIIHQLQELSHLEPGNPGLRSSLLSSGMPVIKDTQWEASGKRLPMYWKDFLRKKVPNGPGPAVSPQDPVFTYGSCFNRKTEAHFYNSDRKMNINSVSYLIYLDQVKTLLESKLE